MSRKAMACLSSSMGHRSSASLMTGSLWSCANQSILEERENGRWTRKRALNILMQKNVKVEWKVEWRISWSGVKRSEHAVSKKWYDAWSWSERSRNRLMEYIVVVYYERSGCRNWVLWNCQGSECGAVQKMEVNFSGVYAVMSIRNNCKRYIVQ